MSGIFTFSLKLVRCVKTTYFFLSYFAHFVLEWKLFRTNVVEKIKTHFLCSLSFTKIVPFMGECGKTLQNRAGHNIVHAVVCLMPHKPRVWKSYVSSAATVVSRTRLNVTFIRTYIVFLIISAFGFVYGKPDAVAYPGIFFGSWGGGRFNKFSWGQSERGFGGGSPLARGSAQYENEWNPYSY
jgi:hypothetical protein